MDETSCRRASSKGGGLRRSDRGGVWDIGDSADRRKVDRRATSRWVCALVGVEPDRVWARRACRADDVGLLAERLGRHVRDWSDLLVPFLSSDARQLLQKDPPSSDGRRRKRKETNTSTVRGHLASGQVRTVSSMGGEGWKLAFCNEWRVRRSQGMEGWLASGGRRAMLGRCVARRSPTGNELQPGSNQSQARSL